MLEAPLCFLTKWGSPGAGDGQFGWPAYVAVDASGNVYADFGNDRVQKGGACDPATLMADIIDQVVDLNLDNGISNSLDAKLANAVKALDEVNEENNVAAINKLEAFINEVQAKRGNKIPEADADALFAAAQQIIDLLASQQRRDGSSTTTTEKGNRSRNQRLCSDIAARTRDGKAWYSKRSGTPSVSLRSWPPMGRVRCRLPTFLRRVAA
jgi:hypothetical protein